MATITKTLPDLKAAIAAANDKLAEQERGYTVVSTNQEVKPKEPIFLQLKYLDGTTYPIDIIHLVHLKGSNWDNIPFEEVARTTDEVTRAILDRINLFFDAAAKADQFYINKNGTIFDFNKIPIELHENETFSVDGQVVTFEGKSLSLTRIRSEDILKFIRLENKHIELIDRLDEREGKGVFIDPDGQVYRA
jgi:hypothetical protein